MELRSTNPHEAILRSFYFVSLRVISWIAFARRSEHDHFFSSLPGVKQAKRRGLMHKYEIIIYWSGEDEVYIAEVPELPGCVAHGETSESAATSANEAIQLWIDTAKACGDPIPKSN